MNKEAAEFEMGLRRLAIACTNDPLLFVQKCFRWGHGELANYEGPDVWQQKIVTSATGSRTGKRDIKLSR